MAKDTGRYSEALARIAELANAALRGRGEPADVHDHDHDLDHDHAYRDDGENVLNGGAETAAAVCTPKRLPTRLVLRAADVARTINPVNAPAAGPLAAAGIPADPMRIAVLTQKYWGPAPRRLSVSFMETTPADLRARILQHLNAWSDSGCISFVETNGTGQVRISRGGSGYWSYLGTDIMLIPKNRPTMNLQGFTMSTPESEYRRVIRHEAGHTLGFPHEHMRKELVARIDPEKAYAYFWRWQGWNKQDVDQQVLTPLEQASIMGTRPDQTSIMCYQLPGSITRDGKPILGGDDINRTDRAFVARIYPKPKRRVEPQFSMEEDDWDPSEDVQELEAA